MNNIGVLFLVIVGLAAFYKGIMFYLEKDDPVEEDSDGTPPLDKVEEVDPRLKLTPKGKSATQAISGATDFIVAVARAKMKNVAPFKIVKTMQREWGATPSQVCFALMNLGAHPHSLNHPEIIKFEELVDLVEMLNQGEKPQLPGDKKKASEQHRTQMGMNAVTPRSDVPAHGVEIDPELMQPGSMFDAADFRDD